MNDNLTMPEPLDPSRLYHPSEVRTHAAKVAAYFEAKREEEAAQRRKQEAAEAAAGRRQLSWPPGDNYPVRFEAG